jgi:hypothetical protein
MEDARTAAEEFGEVPRRESASLAYRNRHDLTFGDVSAAWGFNAVGIAQAWRWPISTTMAISMWCINCLNEPARIYRNESSAPRLAVRLKGALQNTRGIGAKIKVSGAPSRRLRK